MPPVKKPEEGKKAQANGASANGNGAACSPATPARSNGQPGAQSAAGSSPVPAPGVNPPGIPDWRAEQHPFHVESEWVDGQFKYKVIGDTSAEPPPLRDSRYLTPEKAIELFRYMLINRRMEQALEAMYKQSKVIGGLYLSLGQEAASCASA